MAGIDRLSDLSDDLLRRILYFTPAKEAASTTALSRRWRTPLWLSSGALNLEMRIEDYDRYRYGRERKEDEARFYSRRDAFLSAAMDALDAAQHVTRLTLRLQPERKGDDPFNHFLYPSEDWAWPEHDNAIDVLLSHKAARRVEDLRLVADASSFDTFFYNEVSRHVGNYTLTMDSLPSETLRVLELTSCKGLSLQRKAVLVLPRLSSLRLDHCAQKLGSLQRIIDAAPALATICLDSVHIDATVDASPQSDDEEELLDYYSDGDDDIPRQPPPNEDKGEPKEIVQRPIHRLRCPAATVLVLERCRWEEKKHGRLQTNYSHGYSDEKVDQVHGVDIYAPRLRRFRYTGLLRSFTFSPQPPELEQVDLHFFQADDRHNYNKDPNRDLATFWRFFGSFTSTKNMKLRLNHLESIAVLSEAMRVELLPETFCRLKHLELHGVHRPKGKTAAVTIANLLRCCPVLQDLRINLTTKHDSTYRKHAHDRDEGTRLFLERKFRYDRDKSMGRHDHCGDSKLVAYDKVSEIPALSRRSFKCLQSSVTSVGLQFRLQKSDCFGLKLIKFFAENAMVLEEMKIDAGNGKLFEHMNHKVKTWIANSSKKRKLDVPSFVVLPLKRRLFRE